MGNTNSENTKQHDEYTRLDEIKDEIKDETVTKCTIDKNINKILLLKDRVKKLDDIFISNGLLPECIEIASVEKYQNKLTIQEIESYENIHGWYWENDIDKINMIICKTKLMNFVSNNKRLPNKSILSLNEFSTEQYTEKLLVEFYENVKARRKNELLSEKEITLYENLPGWVW